MSALNELMKYGGGEILKRTGGEIAKKTAKEAAKEAVKQGVTNIITSELAKRGGAELSKLVPNATLSGAGISALGKGSGSTLGGVLGRNSGIILPQATKKTLGEVSGGLSAGSILEDIDPSELTKSGLNKRTVSSVKKAADEGAGLLTEGIEAQNTRGVTNKSSLPMLNRDQYYEDTLGKVGKNGMSSKDVPSYMRNHLSNKVDKTRGNDSILREFFGDNESSMSELYDRYDAIARGADQNTKWTKENIDMGLGLTGGNEQRSVEQDIADTFFNGKKNIDITKSPARTQKLNVAIGEETAPEVSGLNVGDKVKFKASYGGTDRWFDGEIVDKNGEQYIIGKEFEDLPLNAKEIQDIRTTDGTKLETPKATLGEKPTITDTELAGENAEDMLKEEIASMQDKIVSAGGSGMGNNGGNTTTFANPEDEGFNIKLKNGETTDVTLNQKSVGSTKQQRAARNLDDITAKSMNANNKQYQKIIGKSNSIGGHYRSVAERMRAEKIDQANVGVKAQAALAGREDIKQQGLQYAEKNGVTINLSNIDNSIGLSAAQKRKLDELGLGLKNMLGDWSGVITPTKAEDIYKTLRDYAYNWSDSKDALTKMAGNACEKEAIAVRNAIDNTMDNIKIDYKTPLVEFMAQNGEDPAYIRKVAAMKDFKFSDLRRDQSDWITINDLAGNKIKEDPTMRIFGVDTGVPNPFSKGAGKAKEKFYERQAYGAGGAGASGGNVPPSGGGSEGPDVSGEPNNINFTDDGTSTATDGNRLRNILSKGKDFGLVGGGILGGLLLGRGGGSNYNSVSGGNLGDMLQAQNMGYSATEEEIDPYSVMTVGGYTYDQLENGYMAALQAGDTSAAKLIQEMIGMLDDKVSRYYTSKKNSTSSAATNSTTQTALNSLKTLYSLYQQAGGGQGYVKGNITNFFNQFGGGYDREMATYEAMKNGSTAPIARGMGEKGVLSDQDRAAIASQLPNATDDPITAEMKFRAMYENLLAAAGQQ